MAATRYVVRCVYLSAADELIAIDSRPLHMASAKRLLARVRRSDSEVLDASLLRWQHNCAPPPPDGIRRVKRLDEVPPIIDGTQ